MLRIHCWKMLKHQKTIIDNSWQYKTSMPRSCSHSESCSHSAGLGRASTLQQHLRATSVCIGLTQRCKESTLVVINSATWWSVVLHSEADRTDQNCLHIILFWAAGSFFLRNERAFLCQQNLHKSGRQKLWKNHIVWTPPISSIGPISAHYNSSQLLPSNFECSWQSHRRQKHGLLLNI